MENDFAEENDATIDGESAVKCSELEKKLDVDNSVDDLEQAYLLYCEYARLSGFSVRKGDNKYFTGTKIVKVKEFVCSCEGLHDAKKSTDTVPAYKRQITRSNCKAKIRLVKADVNSTWKVQRFEKVHNHELAPIHQSYLLRSARHLTNSQKCLVEALKSAGIGVSSACRFFEKESGGAENIGFTRKDVYNHLSAQKLQTNIENVDANALVDFFVKQSNKEPYFYWNTQLDDEGRLMNFFFRDSRCLIDYEHFGDVLSVDTTYKTNKYDLICAPFIGINHHMNNVMFGLAFLSNETTRSFEWLFQTFLESMHGKEPTVIFSDQGGSLVNGINSCFRTAKHRLCQWHVSKNAPSHFGSLNLDSAFKKQWNYCMKEAEDAADFEKNWSSMISTYSLEENRWFTVMYKLRERWSTAFTKDCFSAGLLATSRSEATNRSLKELVTRVSSLFEFVQGYQQVIKEWRLKESAADFYNLGVPGIHVRNSMLLNQISKVLTRNVFLKFSDQISQQITVAIMQHPSNCNDEELEFKVASEPSFRRIRGVKFNRVTHMASCSCRMWETSGIVCRHIFRVYLEMKVNRLPECYLLRRWSKSAKERHPNVCGTYSNPVGGNTVDNMSFVNYVVRLQYCLAEVAQNDATLRQKVMASTLKLKNDVYAALGNPSSSSKDVGVHEVRDPPRKRSATASKQVPISHWKKKKTKKNASKTSIPVEDGCSQQSISIGHISTNERDVENNIDDDDAVGRAIWDTYKDLLEHNLDDDLDTPIDITSIFQPVNSNVNSTDVQRLII